jgi:ATP-binding cassette subfamily B protein
MAQSVADLLDGENPTVAPYAKDGEALLRVTARAETKEKAEQMCDETIEKIREKIGGYIYSTDSLNLEQTVVKLLREKGKKIALAGSSGGGKTTVCQLIPCFYPLTSGEILIDGLPINKIELSSLRENIGIVQQDVFLFSGTVRDNIEYGKPGASMEEIREAAKKANILDFIDSLENGFDTQVGERGVRLSGGQKQRISIARAFLKDPKILILDEATSALDNKSEEIVQKAIDNLTTNRTTFIVAHRLSTIRNADRIAVLRGGVCVEIGSYDELMAKKGLFYQMQTVQ